MLTDCEVCMVCNCSVLIVQHFVVVDGVILI